MVEKIWQRQQKKKKWLQLLRGGDHQAFAEFIEKYKETVFLCCRRLGLSEDEAEDAASETFMAAYKGIGRYSGRAELSTWLWTIAYRQGINYLRKNRKQWQLEAEPDEQVGGSKEPKSRRQQYKTEKQSKLFGKRSSGCRDFGLWPLYCTIGKKKVSLILQR